MKTCTRCNQLKELSSFPINDFGRPRSQCKSCQNEIGKIRAANKKATTRHYEQMSASTLRDLLGLVGYDVPLPVVQRWVKGARVEAANWAYATYLRASDNIIKIPHKPVFIDEFEVKLVRRV